MTWAVLSSSTKEFDMAKHAYPAQHIELSSSQQNFVFVLPFGKGIAPAHVPVPVGATVEYVTLDRKSVV